GAVHGTRDEDRDLLLPRPVEDRVLVAELPELEAEPLRCHAPLPCLELALQPRLEALLDGRAVGLEGDEDVAEPVVPLLLHLQVVEVEAPVVVATPAPREVVVERPGGGDYHVDHPLPDHVDYD